MKTIPLLSCVALICATGCSTSTCEYKDQIEREAYQRGYEDAYIFVLKQVNTCNSYIGGVKLGEGTNIFAPTNCLFFALDWNIQINDVENSRSLITGCHFVSGFNPKRYWIPHREPVDEYLKTK